MIGLYIFDGSISKPTYEGWKKKTDFIPWGELNEVIQEKPNPSGYILMPTTYEKDITGPFVLSVFSDHDFTLKQLEDGASQ